MTLAAHPAWLWRYGMRDAITGERYTCRGSAHSWQPSPDAAPAVPDLEDPATVGIVAVEAVGVAGVIELWKAKKGDGHE